ncbi:glycosyltransferase family 39 protein [Microbacterium nymphoidis]|uniref:glycosyltransferase family 39 protein n=1 Tax=Microbacterium nymphoidis TaxID=2898586 RepID=UPI0027E10F1A|nr:glycosyltransferase family 39 protein [Microbacterium nymphoidis]
MAELTRTEEAAARSAPPTRVVTALRITGIYVAGRILTLVFLYIASALAAPGSRFGPGLGIERFITGWDGQWYWQIAFQGYPSPLPLTDTGAVAENAWAFMPIYPWVANAVGMPFGSWATGAGITSLVCGLLSCFALYRLMRNRLSRNASMWAVVFFANGPLAALFHVGYAEAMFTLFLLLALNAVLRRRFAELYVLIPLMGFTRPGILPFALMLGLYGIWRWFRRDRDPLPRAQIIHILATGALAVLVGFSWQIIAGIVTGDPGAYLSTELAWRRNWLAEPATAFIPFEAWGAALNMWFGLWQVPVILGWITFAVLLALIAWALLRERHVLAMGVELRLWSASYILYLLAVFFPQSSTLRLLLPLTPMVGALAIPRSPWWRGGILIGGVLYQWFWIYSVYALAATVYQIP